MKISGLPTSQVQPFDGFMAKGSKVFCNKDHR